MLRKPALVVPALHLFTLACLLLGLSACAADAAPGPEDEKPDPVPTEKIEYDGPKLAAEIAGTDLVVTITVPSGGHKLELRETKRVEDHSVVHLTLTAPGENTAVTTALEDKVVKVSLPAEAGAVHICVQRITENTEYFTPPEFKLAKVVLRK